MAFNPAEYMARLQSLISGFNTSSNRALYNNQTMNQNASRAMADVNTQYNKQAPRLASGYGRSGRNTANVKSGAFASAMQDFAKDVLIRHLRRKVRLIRLMLFIRAIWVTGGHSLPLTRTF